MTRARGGGEPLEEVGPGEMQPFMPWAMYARMAEEDLGALWASLRTVAPIDHRVERWTPPQG